VLNPPPPGGLTDRWRRGKNIGGYLKGVKEFVILVGSQGCRRRHSLQVTGKGNSFKNKSWLLQLSIASGLTNVHTSVFPHLFTAPLNASNTIIFHSVFSAVRGPRKARWGDCQDPRTRRDGKM